MIPTLDPARQAIQNSYEALRRGDRQGARRWAERAAGLAEHLEDPWLLLAALSPPQESIKYFQRALRINPQSTRARAGLEQTTKVLRLPERQKTQPRPAKQASRPIPSIRRRLSLWLVILALTVVGASLWVGISATPRALAAPVDVPRQSWSQASVVKPTYTPSPVPTSTPIPTEMPPASLDDTTYTVQLGDTLGQIASRFDLSAETIINANNLVDETSIYTGQELIIPGVEYALAQPTHTGGQKRILVDISEQHLYAYEGDTLVFSFVASTGMNNATATGSFSILDKIPNAYGSTWNIWMPNWLGIYWSGSLQNGIHALPIMSNGARLWAGYLGSPISYGCVVLGVDESQLLYDWADVGVPVTIQW